jgi:hypothetical protein
MKKQSIHHEGAAARRKIPAAAVFDFLMLSKIHCGICRMLLPQERHKQFHGFQSAIRGEVNRDF